MRTEAEYCEMLLFIKSALSVADDVSDECRTPNENTLLWTYHHDSFVLYQGVVFYCPRAHLK